MKHVALLIFVGLAISLFAIEEPDQNSTLCNSPAVIEKKIDKHALRFKKEDALRKGLFCTLVGVSVLINVKNLMQLFFDFLPQSRIELQTEQTTYTKSLWSVTFETLFQLFQSALATYVLHKGINHTFSYYTYQHPISWLLDSKVELQDHFDTLLCMIANQEKKGTSRMIDEYVKEYIYLFVKIISKDVREICAFMKYRSTMLPSYKQPTVDLLQSNILLFLADWIDMLDAILTDQTSNLSELYGKTVTLRTSLYEQIDLFKKIDSNHSIIREIAFAILTPLSLS